MPPMSIRMVGRRMFPINNLDFLEFSMMSNKIGESMVWHQGYGHLNFNAMKLCFKDYHLYNLKINFKEDIFF